MSGNGGTIVFIGNCQANALRALYERFVVPSAPETAVYIPNYAEGSDQDRKVIAEAKALVVQVLDLEPKIGMFASSATVHWVPHIWALFLWPYSGEGHPRNEPLPYLPEGPYPSELGDRYLNRMVREGVAPAEAARRYASDDIVTLSRIDRLFEISMDRQSVRDRSCGLATAELIDAYFRIEPLFRTVNHPEERIMRYLALQTFERLGVAPEILLKISTQPLGPVAPKTEVPIHPRIASHFGLSWAPPERRYAYRHEGDFDFLEWTERYVAFEWNSGIEEGFHRASAGDMESAIPVLEAAALRSPRSVVVRSALGELLDRMGRPRRAAMWMREASERDAAYRRRADELEALAAHVENQAATVSGPAD